MAFRMQGGREGESWKGTKTWWEPGELGGHRPWLRGWALDVSHSGAEDWAHCQEDQNWEVPPSQQDTPSFLGGRTVSEKIKKPPSCSTDMITPWTPKWNWQSVLWKLSCSPEKPHVHLTQCAAISSLPQGPSFEVWWGPTLYPLVMNDQKEKLRKQSHLHLHKRISRNKFSQGG